MRTALFGYNKAQTNAELGALREQTEALTEKLIQLSGQMETLPEEQEEAARRQAQIEALQERLALLEGENAALLEENQQLSARLREVDRRLELVGRIYLSAYEEAERIKQQAREQAEDYLVQQGEASYTARTGLMQALDTVAAGKAALAVLLRRLLGQVEGMDVQLAQTGRALDALAKFDFTRTPSEEECQAAREAGSAQGLEGSAAEDKTPPSGEAAPQPAQDSQGGDAPAPELLAEDTGQGPQDGDAPAAVVHLPAGLA